jgi:Anthrone oxygenase
MLVSQLALVASALFTGAAFYVGFAEHAARAQLDDKAQLAQWQPAYKRGAMMQASLAMIGFLLGTCAWYASDDWRWLAGAMALAANWPYTLLLIMPVNTKLLAMRPESGGPESRALLDKWGRLHALRTVLGAVATAIFLWASL